MRRLLAALAFLIFHSQLNANEIDWSGVATQKIAESLRFESFQISATEPISTYGYRLCRFLSPEFYWGGALHAGILGIRGGWFTGGMIAKGELSLGYRLNPGIEALLSTGYNHFLNGNISSPYVGFEIRNIFYELNH